MAGGFRNSSGRKKKPDDVKFHPKSFGLNRKILTWLETSYPKKASQALVRDLLQKQYDAEH